MDKRTGKIKRRTAKWAKGRAGVWANGKKEELTRILMTKGWNKADKDGQRWTKMDKYGQRRTKADSGGLKRARAFSV